MNGRRTKGILILTTLAVSGVALLTWTQTWFSLTLIQDTHAGTSVAVPGEAAGPAVAALGLAGLALGGALAIAGRVLRVVFGILEVLIGGSLVLSAVMALSDPAAASSQTITEFTGVAGDSSTHDFVSQSSATAWPFIAVVAGVILALLGVAVAVTGRLWPTSGRKFDAPTATASSDTHDAVDSWDELSRGEDPTQ
ncbi:Trp biosynthesis-associated membrane protein [Paramicrobacterium chengjingii]|uniref:Trp biosynthesis-associated membrane protein n=1 Tax=Paramicrobacterium chengjingii TaxID=2769067 RepID=A0ABX6YMM1_9MICO|nr:Trp biosynthesis-associated membrane protein [Microbacterium chengjingii]QPZ39978.1 Trp biosynthesis-associated membrane protein [Microbacterium chengjingii]